MILLDFRLMRSKPFRYADDPAAHEGKRLFVHETVEDEVGGVAETRQWHGVIVTQCDPRVIFMRMNDGRMYAAGCCLSAAPPGEYRVEATGEVVVDPDYFIAHRRSSWRYKSGAD